MHKVRGLPRPRSSETDVSPTAETAGLEDSQHLTQAVQPVGRASEVKRQVLHVATPIEGVGIDLKKFAAFRGIRIPAEGILEARYGLVGVGSAQSDLQRGGVA